MKTLTTDVLEVRKLSGGSLIEHPPIFSRNGEHIFIVSSNVVKIYSAVTTEWVRDLKMKSPDPIISIELDIVLQNRLVACNSIGEVSYWNWLTGVEEMKKTLILSTPNPKVLAFKLVYFKNSALISWTATDSMNAIPSVAIINYVNNIILCKYELNNDGHPLKADDVSLAVAAKGLNYFCLIQTSRLHIANLQFNKKTYRVRRNENGDHFTIVVCHPEHDTIATGDIKGRIRLWRNVMSGETPAVDIYHWHHTPVSALAFTSSGTMFYSGGSEAVLVKWVIDEPGNNSFMPRMSSPIAHIAVGGTNSKVCVSTMDNAIHFYDAQMNLLSMMQNFAWIADDHTGLNPYPVGLQVNPRTQSIVMNGRSGHLQFFSTYTNSLLFHLDITSQNYQCPELDKVLFNTRVTQAALNMHWMATTEVWDDFKHTPEVRLKFWAYSETQQTFILNTSVEMPHEKGVNSLKFSSTNSIKNLICASAGKDKTLKLWAQGDTKNIYRQGKVWMCVHEVTYKEFPIKSLGFSSDCSLLAAGFGNTLCVFDTDTFEMKCALTAPNAIGGNIKKVQICIGSSDTKEKNKSYSEQVNLLLKNENHDLFKDVGPEKTRCVELKEMKRLEKLDPSYHKKVFEKLLLSKDLAFDQKIDIFYRLGINYDVADIEKLQVASYLLRKRDHVKRLIKDLPTSIRNLKDSQKYKDLAIYSHLQRLRNKRVASMKWFERLINSKSSEMVKRPSYSKPTESHNDDNSTVFKFPNQISEIFFGNDDYCHLVCVINDSRIIVWNLLTLRVQTSCIFSTKFACIDTQTNLIAVYNSEKELNIFHINSPLPIHTHKNMPEIYGMTWVPHRYPKARSQLVDWQAVSQLYFLNKQQELIYIDTETDSRTEPSLYVNSLDALQLKYNTPFSSIIANKTVNNTKKDIYSWNTSQLGASEADVVKNFLQMSPITMPPLHLLCDDFVFGLCKKTSETSNSTETDVKAEKSEENGELTSSGFDEEEFDVESQEFLDRKELLLKLEAANQNYLKFKKDQGDDDIITKGNFDVSL